MFLAGVRVFVAFKIPHYCCSYASMHCGSVFGDHTDTRIHSWQKLYLLVPPSNLMCQCWKMLLALLYVHTFLVQTLSTSKAGKNL